MKRHEIPPQKPLEKTTPPVGNDANPFAWGDIQGGENAREIMAGKDVEGEIKHYYEFIKGEQANAIKKLDAAHVRALEIIDEDEAGLSNLEDLYNHRQQMMEDLLLSQQTEFGGASFSHLDAGKKIENQGDVTSGFRQAVDDHALQNKITDMRIKHKKAWQDIIVENDAKIKDLISSIEYERFEEDLKDLEEGPEEGLSYSGTEEDLRDLGEKAEDPSHSDTDNDQKTSPNEYQVGQNAYLEAWEAAKREVEQRENAIKAYKKEWEEAEKPSTEGGQVESSTSKPDDEEDLISF